MDAVIAAQHATRVLGGEWRGSYGAAPSPGHSRRDRGMIIYPAPNAPGNVRFHSYNGHSWEECRDHARMHGAIDDGFNGTGSHGSFGQYKPLEKASVARSRQCDAKERIERAHSLWSQREPIGGSLAERYLREARGIQGTLDPYLAFLPAAPLSPYATKSSTRPALIAPILTTKRRLVSGVHLTYLQRDGLGKAPIPTPKKMVGVASGHSVHIDEPCEILAVAEGVETALSYAEVFDVPVWASLSAGGMKNLELPRGLKKLEIAYDRDENGVGQEAAKDLAKRASALSIGVSFRPPPDGCNDWNDCLRADRALEAPL